MSIALQTDRSAEFLLLCRTLAQSAVREYARFPNQFLFLVGTRSEQGVWLSLLIDAEDSMLEIACGEYLPRDLSVNQLCDWIRVRLNRRPLWIFAE